MFDLFLTPEYAPFTIAFLVMIGIGLIEAIGLGLGSLDLDGDMDFSGDALGWLGLGGGLPILIWLTALLGCFTIAGIAVQQIAVAYAGMPLPWGAASAVALITGGTVNSFAAAGLARIMPGYESTAVSVEDLLLERGTVLEGAAQRGRPARAKVIDRHGQPHYVMVEPQDDAGSVAEGETALLVRREGRIFYVVPDTDPVLRPI